jgi:hypothetical protein
VRSYKSHARWNNERDRDRDTHMCIHVREGTYRRMNTADCCNLELHNPQLQIHKAHSWLQTSPKYFQFRFLCLWCVRSAPNQGPLSTQNLLERERERERERESVLSLSFKRLISFFLCNKQMTHARTNLPPKKEGKNTKT